MVDTIVTFQTSGQKFMKTKNDESSVECKSYKKYFNAYLLKQTFIILDLKTYLALIVD